MATIARDRPLSRPLQGLPRWAIPTAAALLLLVAAPAVALGVAFSTMASQARSIEDLRAEVQALETKVDAQPEWTTIARRVEPSVFTIETSYGLGSGWVARSDESGSELVTNFHVVDEAWTTGAVNVNVRQGDRSLDGTITRVDHNDDLALIHVDERLPALQTAPGRPKLGQAVMAVGSPLGLGGSVSIGVVSGFHSLEGSDYVQFSAPISPGNSGGPVVDARGRVVAIASAKFVGQGVEALSLGIPVQTACSQVVACRLGSD